jgi:hypothetical protein
MGDLLVKKLQITKYKLQTMHLSKKKADAIKMSKIPNPIVSMNYAPMQLLTH